MKALTLKAVMCFKWKKKLSIGEMKLNLAEKNVVIHGAEVMLTNREFETQKRNELRR